MPQMCLPPGAPGTTARRVVQNSLCPVAMLGVAGASLLCPAALSCLVQDAPPPESPRPFAMKALQMLAATAPLWPVATAQNVPSAPSAADFLARRGHSVTILNDHLYIDGGQYSLRVDGQMAKHDGKVEWLLNDTLSVSLQESWVNSTVEVKVTKKSAPSLNMAALFRDTKQQSAYMWGGWAVPGTMPKYKELWEFTADTSGGGTWRTLDAANPAFQNNLVRTNAASSATCNGRGMYLGGYEDVNTDTVHNTRAYLPTPGLVTYDIAARTWANVSAVGFNSYGTTLYGAAACAGNFGKAGLFFPIGGDETDRQSWNDNGRSLIDTSVLKFYDVDGDKWHAQPTTGEAPPVRDRHCVAGVQGPNGTYEIVVYGGQDRREGGIKTDMYVLSLPGFVWFKVNGTSAARSSHQCIVANNRQLLVVGGFGANPTYTVQDDWAQGLGVFDLTALAWKDRYDADAQPYEPAPAIADWYKNGGLDSVKWSDDDVKAFFVTSENKSNANPVPGATSGQPTDGSTDPTSQESSSSNGPIIGGVVGGLVGVALVAGALWWFVRRRRARQGQQMVPSSDTTEAGGVRDAGAFDPNGQGGSGYDPTVSQNYQHYAIELNDNNTAAAAGGPGATAAGKEQPYYELVVEHKPHELRTQERPLEMGVETRPQELPGRW